MSVESLIAVYGYPIVLIGAIFEGESIVVTAGFLCHRGYLSFPLVVLLAFAGGFIGDQTSFRIGRRAGSFFLQRHPRLQSRVMRVRSLFQRFENLLVMGFRFFYGMRTVTPIVIGMSGYNARRFFILNGAGTLIWATVVTSAGYFFGHVIELLLVDIKRHEKWIALAILLVGAAAWLYNRRLGSVDKTGG